MPTQALVGRDEELARLVAAFEDVRAGTARSVLIRGPSGAGGPALVAAMRSQLTDRRLAHRWRATRGLPGESAYAALAGLFPVNRAEAGGGLESLLEGLAAVPVEVRPAVVGERLAHALQPADARPQVVVVEHAHLLDSRARTALATAAQALLRTRTLVLATAHEGSGWPADLVVPLGPLADPAAAALAHRLATHDPDRARELLDLGRGLPGLMVAWSRWPDLRVPAGQLLVEAHAQAAAVALAAGLAQGNLTADDLAAAAGAELQVVDLLVERGVLRRSPAGVRAGSGWTTRDAWFDAALQAVTGEEQRAIAGRVGSALAGPGVAGPGVARLIGRALELAGQPGAARSAWRRAADEAGADADARADCLLRALGSDSEAPGPAAPVLTADEVADRLMTADALLAVGRAGEAADLLAEASTRLPRAARAWRARLLTRERRALLLLGRHADAGRVLEEAQRLVRGLAAPEHGDPLGHADSGHPDRPEHPDHPAGADHTRRPAHLTGPSRWADPDPDPLPDPTDAAPLAAAALAEVGTALALSEVLADPRAAVRHAAAACRAAQTTGDPATRAAALGALGLAQGLTGQVDSSIAAFDTALGLAESGHDRALETRLAANRIYVLWRAGRLQEMAAALTTELTRLGRSGLVEAAGGQLLVGRAVVLHGLGHWPELAEHLARALGASDRLGGQVELLLRLIEVELAGDLGQGAHARSLLAELAARPAFDDPDIAFEVMTVRLGLATLGGQLTHGQVHALVDEGLALARGLEGDPFAAARVRVAALRLLGWGTDRGGGPLDEQSAPTARASETGHAEPAEPDPPTESGSGTDPDEPVDDEPVEDAPVEDEPAELRALRAEERAWLTGHGWDRAIAAWDGLPMPYRRAWAQVAAAHAVARAGERDAALHLVAAARPVAVELDAAPLLSVADRLTRRLGRRGSPGGGRREGELTAREHDVVVQVALGRTNREIARTLGMSERTVAVHLTRIFAKLGAGTRGEVAHVARQAGLVDP